MKTVCLIGRPNTGKSSLFNCFLREERSIIMDEPGVTRDRIYGIVKHNDKSFYLIDTGGLELGKENFKEDILAQAEYAIDEADLVLFVVDGKTELNQSDFMIRDLLRKSKKEVFVVANKLDNKQRQEEIYRFYELGFENIFGVSAAHKIGLRELLYAVTNDLKEDTVIHDDSCKFCLIGRPNVGKSSLVNALLNEERAIVSDVAGTTRDATDTRFNYHGKSYTMIDTAGIRKRGRIYENIEKYSLLRSLKAIERSDGCVLVINAEEKIIEHDKHIAGIALEQGKALVIAVNKWDTVSDSNTAIKEWKELLKYEFQFAPFAKVVFLSAKTKKRVGTLMPEIIAAYENYHKTIKTSLLNDVIHESTSLHVAPSYKGRRLKIYFVNQEATEPPKFTFYVNDKGLVHFSYERYLENKLRENFDLTGTPIILKFKNRSEE